MSDAAAAPGPEPARPHRRGVIRSALRLARHAGSGVEAALELGLAEARLARAAVPHVVLWFCVSIGFGVSLLACGWAALLYWLVGRTGSLGVALAWMAVFSAGLFALSVILLVRCVRWLRFLESRRRLAQWLAEGKDDARKPG